MSGGREDLQIICLKTGPKSANSSRLETVVACIVVEARQTWDAIKFPC